MKLGRESARHPFPSQLISTTFARSPRERRGKVRRVGGVETRPSQDKEDKKEGGGCGETQLGEEEGKRARDSASSHQGITRSNRFVESKIVDETRGARSCREACGPFPCKACGGSRGSRGVRNACIGVNGRGRRRRIEEHGSRVPLQRRRNYKRG